MYKGKGNKYKECDPDCAACVQGNGQGNDKGSWPNVGEEIDSQQERQGCAVTRELAGRNVSQVEANDAQQRVRDSVCAIGSQQCTYALSFASVQRKCV